MANILRYPLQRIDANSDYLRISILEYTPPGLGGTGDQRFTLSRSSSVNRVSSDNKNVKGTILLPIPEGLQDQNAVNWGDSSLDSITSAGGDALLNLVKDLNIDDLSSNPGGTIENAFNNATGAAKDFLGALDGQTREAIVRTLTTSALALPGSNVDFNSLSSRAQGIVLNPNLELLFKAPLLRNFQFNFSITPRSRAESLQVKSIINTFKRRMAAKTSTNGTAGSAGIFIKAPDVFALEFRRGNSKHPFLFSMQTCALKNMTTNYAGTGSYTTYEDSTPVKMGMSLSFQELSPVYAEDYSNNLEEGVGF